MKQTDPQFKLRLDEDLKAALTAAAKQNQRTLSAEIVSRLQASFEGRAQDSGTSELVIAMLSIAVREARALIDGLPPGALDGNKHAETLTLLDDVMAAKSGMHRNIHELVDRKGLISKLLDTIGRRKDD